MSDLTVTVTVTYRGSTTSNTTNATSGNPLYAALEAERAIQSAGLRASKMLAAVYDDVRTVVDPPPSALEWPLAADGER